MHDLQATLTTLQAPEMANRIRRVIRDEISCGLYLEIQSIRFDIQIARPQYYAENESMRHLHVVQRAISYLLKSKHNDQTDAKNISAASLMVSINIFSRFINFSANERILMTITSICPGHRKVASSL